MKISIRLFTQLREITGKKEVTLSFPDSEEVTLDQVVKMLEKEYGKDFADYVYDAKTNEVRGFLQFLVNGKSAIDGQMTRLSDGDLIAILPPVGGG